MRARERIRKLLLPRYVCAVARLHHFGWQSGELRLQPQRGSLPWTSGWLRGAGDLPGPLGCCNSFAPTEQASERPHLPSAKPRQSRTAESDRRQAGRDGAKIHHHVPLPEAVPPLPRCLRGATGQPPRLARPSCSCCPVSAPGLPSHSHPHTPPGFSIYFFPCKKSLSFSSNRVGGLMLPCFGWGGALTPSYYLPFLSSPLLLPVIPSISAMPPSPNACGVQECLRRGFQVSSAAQATPASAPRVLNLNKRRKEEAGRRGGSFPTPLAAGEAFGCLRATGISAGPRRQEGSK